ncbi:MBL fold metallo-hydrolase [Paenochrobactrum glaciei]|uniref:MBL fold metallo-hydrolase n=2 Tax=Paenochrobactrum glaciei TaxID=486407 RepID=A0ABN1GL08_9HYPH
MANELDINDTSDTNLKIHFLGTGSPIPLTSRFGPSILIQAGDQYLLFDGGRGAIQRIYSLGIPFPKIDKLFITHLHSDHTVGIPDIFLTSWVRGRKTPFEVWGPEGTTHLMNGIRSAFEYDIKIRIDQNDGSNIKIHDIDEGIIYDKDELQVIAFQVDHGPVKPAFGYRINYKGKSVLLSGDTRYDENLIKYAKDVDVIVHEVASTSDNMANAMPMTQKIVDIHTTPEEAGKIFALINPKLAIYSHIVLFDVSDDELVRKTNKNYQGPLLVANDLMTVSINDNGYNIMQNNIYKD